MPPPLPTSWERPSSSLLGPRGNARYLEVDGLRVRYVGPGTSDKDAASVRADAPVPETVGAFYWEVTVVSAGRDGFIGERGDGGDGRGCEERREAARGAGAGCVRGNTALPHCRV